MTTPVLPNSLEARDAAVALHPFSNARKLQKEGSLLIAKGDGIYVEDVSGKRYIEAMSGLWSVAVGFSEPRLGAAAAKQFAQLPYYHAFGQKGHVPLVELSEKLVQLAPVPMSKVFLTNSGSEANDTVLKMVWYRSNALGQPQRKKVIARKNGYHGITIGSGSLTGIAVDHASFDLPLPQVRHTGCPHHWREALPGESEEAFATRLADELEALILAEGPETVAAFIAEPVQGAGGVIVPPATYWAKIQAVVKKYDLLLIADEVICGFGRTGRMFACETFGIEPDILVLSKQLSSSYLPISAIVMNDRVFGPLADESARIGSFAHGFTGGGHPVAAAVALENIAIIEERDLVGNAARVGAAMQDHLRRLASHPLVGEARGVGLIGALELVTDKAAKTALEKTGALGALVNGHLQDNGVISRAMGDALAFCPPLIVTGAQVDDLFGRVEDALNKALKDLSGKVAA